jgi:hypothetical protein
VADAQSQPLEHPRNDRELDQLDQRRPPDAKWRFRLKGAGAFGKFSSNPIVLGNTI